ncbi:hypothetical protein D6D12_01022 [Aureobasidium pullulans]|uniref:GPI anchored serine-rich protein n=1 Tax=Aureobasidium pullulans TaxID=5580 RepID=A0A4S9EM97_AURPU|nr:hypothetical protein D6D15_01616 [Aureobasidium pullulans]THX34224.1 hypothetical protein D6D12_01022 [Aureobasidium pullulans]THX54914.1 hypothetical protein D6D11_04001 [Aureobasidium pullulans]
MRFAIVASALFAGLVAAAPAITETVHSTAVETITSCGPEVTNCPARSASAATSAPVVPTSAPVVAAVQNTTAPAAGPSTVTLYSTQAVTITSCGPEVTNCPARVSSSLIPTGYTTVPVAVQVPSSAPFAMVNSTMTAPQGTAASTGFGASATQSMPSSYTGAAGKLNAGIALAGVAGFAALLI